MIRRRDTRWVMSGTERGRAGGAGRGGPGWARRVGVAQAVVAVNSDFRQVHRL